MRLGQAAFSDQQAAFLQSQSPSNPHSAKSIAMNPRYFQPYRWSRQLEIKLTRSFQNLNTFFKVR